MYHKNQTYRILSPSYEYNSRGVYLNFGYFNVEQRQRVLYIDYLYGIDFLSCIIENVIEFLDIPISSQWQSTGHFYPIQIAQFGLSHWSRLQFNSKSKSDNIYRFERIQPNQWLMIKKEISLSNSFIHFTISSNTSLHIRFLNNNIELIYSTMIMKNLTTPTKIIIPIKGFPRQVNRHMRIDIEKSLKKSLIFKHDFLKIQLHGQSNSSIDQLIIGNQTSYSQQAFYSSTHWLLKNQDFKTGCWFSYVQREYPLRMPWCSAMAQG